MSLLHHQSDSLRLPSARGPAVEFTFDGRRLTAYEGETVAAALVANGQRALRTTVRDGEPRGAYCLIGVCFDCLVRIDGRTNRRACQLEVRPGMQVESQHGDDGWEHAP